MAASEAATVVFPAPPLPLANAMRMAAYLLEAVAGLRVPPA